MKRLLIALLLPAVLPYTLAGTPQFTDAQQEAQYYDLIRVVRCPTCQNQNVAESDAPLARQLREQIESQIKAGRGNSEITAYLVERYGDFITYEPPFAARTWLLWLTPFAVMGATLAFWLIRRRPRHSAGLSAAERAELHTLIAKHRKTP